MTIINELRIRIIENKIRLRQTIAKILLYLLAKVDITALKSLILNEKLIINLAPKVPQDNKWHKLNVTIDMHIKRNKRIKKTKKEIGFFLDGTKI